MLFVLQFLLFLKNRLSFLMLLMYYLALYQPSLLLNRHIFRMILSCFLIRLNLYQLMQAYQIMPQFQRFVLKLGSLLHLLNLQYVLAMFVLFQLKISFFRYCRKILRLVFPLPQQLVSLVLQFL